MTGLPLEERVSHSWGCSIKTDCGDGLGDKKLPSRSLGGAAHFSLKDQKSNSFRFPVTQLYCCRADAAKRHCVSE